jgi:hypothetical protein
MTAANDKTPPRNDHTTIPCPICGTPFPPAGRRRYCTNACRATAHRRRHQPEPTPTTPLPAPGHRRARTIYQCPGCDTRALGEQRCEDCGTFMTRLGYGGLCPCCDEPITLDELLNT